MAAPHKARASPKQSDLDLSKLSSGLDGVPDELVLGKLQSALETLLSERSHPMIVALTKRLEHLKSAESLIQRELDARDHESPGKTDTPSSARHGIPASESTRSLTKDEIAASNIRISKRKRSELNAADASDEMAREDDASGDENIQGPESGDKLDGGNKNNDEDDNSQDIEEDGDAAKPPGNDRFVPNPKSEYVPTQALPVHALGLFDENDDDESEEALKRKLGVVSFPKEDLSTLTAGPVPMDDFTRAKPSNQVQFSTYATFLEPYFRQFTDEDIHFLQQPNVGGGMEAANLRGGKKLSPYVLPPLGPNYKTTWQLQDAEMNGEEISDARRKSIASQTSELTRLYTPAGAVQDINDTVLDSFNNRISLGPFTERLVAALMPEARPPAVTPQPTETGAENGGGPGTPAPEITEPDTAVSSIPIEPGPAPPAIDDFAHIEERVKGEFRYVGVLDLGLMRKFEQTKNEFKLAVPQHRDEYGDPSSIDVDWVNGAEDDEISRELRLLQGRLKEVSGRNSQYKQRLLPIVQEQLAWQEYQSILQDLDKQVDQGYLKRLKAPKVPVNKNKKKKGSAGLDSPADSPGTPLAAIADAAKLPDQKPAIRALLDKRERWISKIGPLFRPAYEMMREYEKPKFDRLDANENQAGDDEDEEDAED